MCYSVWEMMVLQGTLLRTEQKIARSLLTTLIALSSHRYSKTRKPIEHHLRLS